MAARGSTSTSASSGSGGSGAGRGIGSPFLSHVAQQHLVLVVASVGVASSALTALGIFSFQEHKRRRRRRELRDRVRRATSTDDGDAHYGTRSSSSSGHPPGLPRADGIIDDGADAYDDVTLHLHDASIGTAGPSSRPGSRPRTPHPPASPLVGNTPSRHAQHLSASISTDGGTPRYLSQLQLQAAAAAVVSQNSAGGSGTGRAPSAIPPPLLPKPHRTSSSSSLRSSLTGSTLAPHASAHQLPGGPGGSGGGAHTGLSKFAQTYPESLIREQLARHYSFFSPATLQSQRAHLLATSQHPDLPPIFSTTTSKSKSKLDTKSRDAIATTSPPPAAEEDIEGLGMPAIRSAFVIVVGVGGVGSHAALALLRSGVGHLRLIDFDQVSLSSLNRHACATLADVGRSKVQVCAEKLGAIAPWANVEAYNELFRASEAKRLLTSPRKPDFIIDAIDNIDTKVDLIAFAYNNQIRIITASGAGAKSDPSRIQIADLSATSEDPLARSVRRRLRLLGVPKIRDKLGEGHGSAPRARTVKKREKEQQEKGKKDDEPRPETPVRSAQAESSAKVREGSIPLPSPLESFATPVSTPFFEEEGSKEEEANGGISRSASVFRLASASANLTSPSPARRFTHSRRASSTSSTGNARYETPLMSPSELRGGVEDLGMSLPPMVLEEKFQPNGPAGQDEAPEDTGAGRGDAEDAVDDVNDEDEEEDAKVERKEKGKPYSRERKPHSHALTPSALLRSSLEVDPTTGHRLTLPCVFSTEKSDVRLLELPESEVGKGPIEELAALEDFRVRVLPVLGPIPAMFGLAAATYVLCEIAGWPMEPLPFLNRRKMYEKMFSDLEVCERRYPYPHANPQTANKLPFAPNDVAYLTEEVFHSRSCIPPFPTLTTAAVLMRWDSTLPLGFNNVVLLTKEEAKVHAKEVLKAGRSPWEVWGRAAAEEVKRRMVAERRMQVFR